MPRIRARALILASSLAALTLLLLSTGLQAETLQFRGPDRDGIYSATGLAKSWPEGGPKMLWSATGLNEGYASVSVASGKIFTTGMKDQQGTVFAFDTAGKKLWATTYGEEHKGNGYPGTRTTPTYDDGTVYVLSSMGQAVALDATTGKIQWQVNILESFGAENLYFGVSESPLVDGENVIFTPGGKDAVVVALNKKTGETHWVTKGLPGPSAYCSPRILEHGKHRQLVTFLAKEMIGIDPESGSLLWRHEVPVSYDIHANSPLFDGDMIYVSHAYGKGSQAFRLAADGKSVSPVWSEEKLDIHHGGGVLLNGNLYGAADKKTWHILDGKSGESLASIRRLGKGAVVFADGLLYGYTEAGEVLLVNPDPKSFEVISRFEITQGEGQHWAHPVITDGVLYIRHGDALMAFDIAAGAEAPAPQEKG